MTESMTNSLVGSYPVTSQETWMSTQDASGAIDLERQFTEIVEQYCNLPYSFAFQLLRNSEDADGAVQKAYISVFKALPHFKGLSKLPT